MSAALWHGSVFPGAAELNKSNGSKSKKALDGKVSKSPSGGGKATSSSPSASSDSSSADDRGWCMNGFGVCFKVRGQLRRQKLY